MIVEPQTPGVSRLGCLGDEMHEYEANSLEPSPLTSRIGVGVVLLLVGAFTLGTMSVFLAPAHAEDQIAGNRDDDAREVATVSGDDDDDDDDTGNSGRGSNSGSVSIGSNSGDTRTGTTNGTGKSRSVSNSSGASKNTATGTTRGTGQSKSVSNSS